MYQKNFKVGLFAFNASNGVTLTTSNKRWKPTWNKIKKISLLAENSGLDFLLPVARWNDWGGDTRPHKETFETFSLMSSLASITRKIYLFSTIHTAFIHPIIAARTTSSISNVCNGRFGVNIVCGWNKSEYEMFNVKTNYSSVQRYKYGDEWLKIYNNLLNKNTDKFNFKGNFFNLKNAQCFPKIVDDRKFLSISAGFSEKGREFACKNFDILLTMFGNLETLKKNNLKLIKNAKKNHNNIEIFSPIHIVCKNSKNEALDFYEEYSNLKQDKKAVNNFIGNLEWSKKNMLAAYLKQVKQKIAGSLGSYTIIDNPKNVIEKLYVIKKSKINGIALTFFDYEKDLIFFIKKILPAIKKF